MTGNRVSSSVQVSPIDWALLDDDPTPIARADVPAIDVELRPGQMLDIGVDGDAVAFVVEGAVVCRFADGDRTIRAGDSVFIGRGETCVSHVAGDDDAVARLFVVRGIA